MLEERPEERKGLFISSVGKRSLLLPPKAVGNASQCLVERHFQSEEGGAPLQDGGDVGTRQLSKSFQEDSPGALQQPAPHAGLGRLSRALASSSSSC